MNNKKLISLLSIISFLIFSLIFVNYVNAQTCSVCVSNTSVSLLTGQDIYPYEQITLPPNIASIDELRVDLDDAVNQTPVKLDYFPSGLLPFTFKISPSIKDLFLPLCSTYYEELKCVGLYPEKDLLWAVVEIKKTYGYGTDLCGDGIYEYITFWIDWDNDGKYENPEEYIGMRRINVHNISNDLRCDCKCKFGSIYYSTSLRIPEPQRKFCWNPNLVKVRAILSRHVPQNNPNKCPSFGNILDRWVQIKPIFPFIIKPINYGINWQDYFTGLIPLTILPPEIEIIEPEESAEEESYELNQSVLYPYVGSDLEAYQVADLDIYTDDLKYLYEEADVENERIEYESIINQFIEEDNIVDPNGSSPPLFYDEDLIEPVSLINPGWIINTDIVANYPALRTLWNTKYEEMKCVGYNPDTERLTAIIHIKRPKGYGGNLCTGGIKEYVRFWIDWDCDGFDIFDNVGVSYVKVGDIKNIPLEGLYYAVSLKIRPKSRPCNMLNVYPVRAILSRICPKAVPTFSYHWGNAMDSCIQMKPLKEECPCPAGTVCPSIYTIGEMSTEDIDPNGYANGWSHNDGFFAVDSPFGGTVTITGMIYNVPNFSFGCNSTIFDSPNVRYKFEYRRYDHGLNAWTTWDDMLPRLQNRFQVEVEKHSSVCNPVILAREKIWNVKDAQGYYSFYFDDKGAVRQYEIGFKLMPWHTSGLLDGLYEIRMVVKDGSNLIYSCIYPIVLDNTRPTVGLYFTLGTCFEKPLGTTITGTFTAYDQHLDYYKLHWSCGSGCGSGTIEKGIYDSSQNNVDILNSADVLWPFPSPLDPPTFQALGADARGFSLNTYISTNSSNPSQPCGYFIKVDAWDRAIVNNCRGSHHSSIHKNFCLTKPKLFSNSISFPNYAISSYSTYNIPYFNFLPNAYYGISLYFNYGGLSNNRLGNTNSIFTPYWNYGWGSRNLYNYVQPFNYLTYYPYWFL